MNKNFVKILTKDVLSAILFTGVAVLVRVIFFGGLGRGIPYLTFYPTVALVAMFGTLRSGALVTAFSFFLTYLWIQQGYLSGVEWMAEVVFVSSGIVISFVGGRKNNAQSELEIAKSELELKNQEISKQNAQLLNEVAARSKADKNLKLSRKELDQKIKDLEIINELMVGREVKMVELKNEIEALQKQLAEKSV
jgi:hypothetical protein